MNLRRFRVQARDLLLIRFDPGVRSRNTGVRIESQQQSSQNAQLDPRREAFGLPGDYGRSAVWAQNANIADALSRVQTADGLTRVLDVTPLNSTRNVNSHRNADELTVKLAWSDFPFDARIVYALALFHFEGTLTAEQYARFDRIEARPSNLQFVGMADEVGDDHGTGGDYVSIKARDLTGVLLDTKLPTLIPSENPIQKFDSVVGGLTKTIRPGRTILEVIRNLLDTLHGTAADFIRGPFLRPGNLELPKLDRRRYPKLATTAASRNQAGKGGGEPWVLRHSSKAGDESYWDAITDLCVSHGLVPFIQADMLVIQPPRTLFTGTPEVIGRPGQANFPTPYRSQRGEVTPHRRMVWGGNVDTLRFHRKLARIKAPVVRVTSYNPDAKDASKRLISVMHPKIGLGGPGYAPPNVNPLEFAPAQPTVINFQGGGTVEVHNVVVQGILDKKQLRSIAEATYEAMGRSQLGITFTTSDVSSWSDVADFDPNADPDLLSLASGDPIELLVSPASRDTSQLFSLNELGQMIARVNQVGGGGAAEYTSAIEYLVARGWDRDDARQIARVLGSANLMTIFRVVQAAITIDGEGGDVQIQVDARDYIRARADPQDASAVGTATTVSAASGVVA